MNKFKNRCLVLYRAPLSSVMIGAAVPLVASDRAISPPFPPDGRSCICKPLPLPLGLPISEGARRKNHNCMNDFHNPENRKMILDFIDDYVDVVDAVKQHQST